MDSLKPRFDENPHIVTIGVPAPYMEDFRAGRFPRLKTAEYPNFSAFELHHGVYRPDSEPLRVCAATKLVIADLVSDPVTPSIPFSRQCSGLLKIFPKAKLWFLTNDESEGLAHTFALDNLMSSRVLGFTPYEGGLLGDEDGVLEAHAFYRKAIQLALPPFSY